MLFEGFTEDVAAVAMYTCDFGSKDFESNPYRIINRRNFAEMQRASELLYLVMSALRKLPRVTGRMLYRGMRDEVSLDKNHYHKGNVVAWDRNITNMPACDFTIAALWTANNYTVTFNPSGGSVSQSTKVVAFGSAYGGLPNATRTGYTFLGWFTEKNESITEESIVNTPDNHTIYAHWLEVRQNQVEIVFSTKDMTKNEIEEAIKKYTEADFTITVIENISDEIRVIVEFVDAEKANEFVRDANAALEKGEGDKIKRVDFVQKAIPSFSPAHHPMRLLFLI